MKNLRSLSRRVLAVTASAIIGLVGAVALATPASAHHSAVSGDPYCDTDTGEWVVTWTVDSFAPHYAPSYRLLDVQSTPAESAVTGITVTDGPGYPHSTGASLIGEQRLDGDATSASLGVRAQWSNGYTEENLVWGQVNFNGPCEIPQEPGQVGIQASSTCEELIIVLTNPGDGEETTATVLASTAAEPDIVPVPVDDTVTLRFPGTEGLSVDVTIGEETTTYYWVTEECEAEVQVPVAYLPDCDSLTIEVTNPLDDETIEAVIVSGDQSETLTIEPGGTGEATFDAEEGTVATITIGDESLEIPWEGPEDCDGEGGELPVTGDQTVMAAGAALALLALGSGLFLLTRRRRVTFTV